MAAFGINAADCLSSARAARAAMHRFNIAVVSIWIGGGR